jgi:hydroxymethylglutaryl-CoA lyase
MKEPAMKEKVTVCEVGPRDGLQIAKTMMATQAKVNWIAAMAAAGVSTIEVGSFVPPKLIPQMADTAAVVKASLALPGLTVEALVPNLRGAQDAYAAGAHGVGIPRTFRLT